MISVLDYVSTVFGRQDCGPASTRSPRILKEYVFGNPPPPGSAMLARFSPHFMPVQYLPILIWGGRMVDRLGNHNIRAFRPVVSIAPDKSASAVRTVSKTERRWRAERS